jgi:hypothetical protein
VSWISWYFVCTFGGDFVTVANYFRKKFLAPIHPLLIAVFGPSQTRAELYRADRSLGVLELIFPFVCCCSSRPRPCRITPWWRSYSTTNMHFQLLACYGRGKCFWRWLSTTSNFVLLGIFDFVISSDACHCFIYHSGCLLICSLRRRNEFLTTG